MSQDSAPKKEKDKAPAQKQEKKSGFTKTEVMIPMRDGVKLNTMILVPNDTTEKLPFLMQRTPYGIGGADLGVRFGPMAKEGYIFVFQDVRGRFKSEGIFAMMSAGVRDRKDPKGTDDTTDAYDTIEWLLKNVENNNGRVGIYGVSYPGWLAAMALLDPHPALKAASPQSSPIDQWMGDDFRHNGAFRLSYGFEYTAMMETDKTNQLYKFDKLDTYDWYLKLGALSNVNERLFKNKMPTWNNFVKHPDYDAFWRDQALVPYLNKITVPTLNVTGWFDQEDFRGPLKIYEYLEKVDKDNKNFLVVGPWNHGGWGGAGSSLGKIDFGSATGTYFREKIQAPFFAYYLKDKGDLKQPEALLFQTGSNKWVSHDKWPVKNAITKKLYFHSDRKLSFNAPEANETEFDGYRSDPNNPVPYRPRPIRATYQGPGWSDWVVQDQRFNDHRPDVLTYQTEPLEEDIVIGGSITAKLFAATSGTDSDWMVRIIDVYPESYRQPDMSGYQLMISGEPLRGRYRKSFEKPEPIVPNQVEEYSIDLHWNHHCFQKGHRIMVQVSSTWFPVIDRNPQKYVPNIFEAKDSDFQAADQKVYHSPKAPSHMELMIMPNEPKAVGSR
ncbi:CocE/NonD family hydrolase [Telmatocola sphagniphila]|uniref:CocE/NonD family hydrolase n=2 Tax=Telmatocola sphagniphila TaxID=1123043 RepID=A0A8E6BBP8_9BACT|nr:CocE/NonD family hydrolase [Telmatocola sphagniphila]